MLSISFYEEIEIPLHLINSLNGKFHMQEIEFNFDISNISKKEYMLFDRSLTCFIFNNCIIFTNFDIIKPFLFQIFDIVIEDKTVINFLINLLVSKNFSILFKQCKNSLNAFINNYKVIDYILDLMNREIKIKDNPWCLKLSIRINQCYKFLIYICREKDFDVLIDPRYY